MKKKNLKTGGKPVLRAMKNHAVWKSGWQSGMESAADIVLFRAEQLQRNNCKDTIREYYAEQAIRTAARF